MNTITVPQTAPTKESLYDKIGECNVKIVTLEQDILTLERQVSGLQNAETLEEALREDLSEKRSELFDLHAQAKRLRMTIKGRLEIELEAVKKQLESVYVNAASLEDLTNHDFALTCEIDKLAKLIEA